MAEGSSEDDYIASQSDETPAAATQDRPSGCTSPRTRGSHQQRKPAHRPSKGYLSNNYRNLLNVDIEALRLRSQGSGLVESQIGASGWTSREKEALFQCLSARGPGNIAALARATRTKSEQEVRMYLLLLQQGSAKQKAMAIKHPRRTSSLHVEIPAAVELSAECERALDLAADALAVHVEKHISQQECIKVGNDWLVDQDLADRMDLYQERKLEIDLHVYDSAEADAKSPAPKHEASTSSADFIPLLRPSLFLQLSRNVFMNNGEDLDLNWHHIDPISADSKEPALFRTALEDFNTITISLIRRMVQATIFQATSRLRAEDGSRKDWTPLEAIREVDVRTAADLLNLPRNSKKYWATATRRCKVGVYSDSKKFADGRPSTKSGHRLTSDEVESELGFPSVRESETSQPASSDGFDEGDVDDAVEDSDMFTEDEIEIPIVATPLNHGELARSQALNGRKRALSPSSFHRVEDVHLEALDNCAGIEEEKRLWDLLRLEPPGNIKTSQSATTSVPKAKPLTEDNCADWRTQCDYQAEWELPNGMPKAKRFKEMDSVGKAAKTKRERLFARLRVRIESDYDHESKLEAATKSEEDDIDDDD